MAAIFAAAAATFPAAAADNGAITRPFAAAFAAGDKGALEEIVAADVVDHNLPPGTPPGRQGLLDAVALYRSWFPDVRITVEHQVAEDDLVVQYGMVTGTNTGPYLGGRQSGPGA